MHGQGELDFVAWMSKLGRDDRDLYRVLRSEAWELAQSNHEQQTPEERAVWLCRSS